MDPLSEIKARIPIEELVSSYVQIKKAGRSFKALCPFHKEKTPSFIISPERQLAYCFGCRKGGDHFKFIQEIEGLDFKGALGFLAERAGVALPKMTLPTKEEKSQHTRLVEIHEEAVQFFENQLWNSSPGKAARLYLEKRGFSEAIVKQAHCGYAPAEDRALFIFLLEKGFTRTEIVASGLVIVRDTGKGECIDRFRGRLLFPIYDLSGAPCAFGGRSLQEGDEAKYLNSPETALYHKGQVLYGLDAARASIRVGKSVIIVEGYMDALACLKAGITNVVASSGTAVTEDQLRTLKRFSGKLILALDRDTAGKLAAERTIELAFAQDFEVIVAVWESDAKDPDECIQKAPEIFRKAIENPLPAAKFLIDQFAKQYGEATPAEKKQIITALCPFWNRIKSAIELDAWIQETAARFSLSPRSLYDELRRFQGKQKIIRDTRPTSAVPKNGMSAKEYLVGLLLTYPETRRIAKDIVDPKDFEDSELENIYRSLTSEYNQPLSDELRARANVLGMFAETSASNLRWEEIQKEVMNVLDALLRQRYTEEKREILVRLKTEDEQSKASLLETYQNLLSTEADLRSTLWQKSLKNS